MADKAGIPILSEAEAAAARDQLRKSLKVEFQKKASHPFRHGHGEGGYLVSLKIQRQFETTSLCCFPYEEIDVLETDNTQTLNCLFPSLLLQFDPAIQRFTAMKASQLDHFKATPKTARLGFLTFVLPLAGVYYYLSTSRV